MRDVRDERITYKGYVVNGLRFHTRKCHRIRKTQNSGVMVKGDDDSGGVDFYGLLEKMIVLEYNPIKNHGSPVTIIFRHEWFNVWDKRIGVKRYHK